PHLHGFALVTGRVEAPSLYGRQGWLFEDALGVRFEDLDLLDLTRGVDQQVELHVTADAPLARALWKFGFDAREGFGLGIDGVGREHLVAAGVAQELVGDLREVRA